MSLVGFLSFVVLSRFAFDAPILAAVAGGLVFTFANNLWVHVLDPLSSLVYGWFRASQSLG